MIVPGRTILARQILTNLRSPAIQRQPCGVDLTLKRILRWTSPGAIDFDNSRRESTKTEEIPFTPPSSNSAPHKRPAAPITTSSFSPFLAAVTSSDDTTPASISLAQGAYLVEFNEFISVPLNVMGQLFVRSSLFRSGALLSAGVMDSGYEGAIGGLLQVVNPTGLPLYRDARLRQMVFHEMAEKVEGYNGVYQGRSSI